jgi:alpha-N-arabinofuranosidase
VLAECYDAVDHVSLHNYYDPTAGDLGDFLASGMDLDRAISAVVSTADHVGARLGSRRRLKVAVDEWNVWYQSRFHGEESLEWAEHRALIEDTYDVADAVVVGSLMVTLLRHADRVGIACQAQLVNVIAPIRTAAGGPAWRQTIFHPFAQAAALARGDVLRIEPRVPGYDAQEHGDVPLLDASATYDEESGSLTLFAVNRSVDDDLELDVDLRAWPALRVETATTLAGPDGNVRATNTADRPAEVRPRDNPRVRLGAVT